MKVAIVIPELPPIKGLNYNHFQRRLCPESVGGDKIKVNAYCGNCLQLLAREYSSQIPDKAPVSCKWQ